MSMGNPNAEHDKALDSVQYQYLGPRGRVVDFPRPTIGGP